LDWYKHIFFRIYDVIQILASVRVLADQGGIDQMASGIGIAAMIDE
jgi:hypothetical protein